MIKLQYTQFTVGKWPDWIVKSMRFIYSIFVLWLISHSVSAYELVYVAGSEQIFKQPHDIVLSRDRRYLYIADNNNDRIAVLDPDSLTLIGTFGEGQVREPHDVVFQSADTLLVADTGNNRIAIFNVQGANAELVGELRGTIRRPEGVAVHSNGRIYATGAVSGNIEAFENGESIAVAEGLSAPHDISIAPDGSLWIADAGNDRLVNMNQALRVIRSLKGPPYQFSGPRYLDFDQAGRLYVADKYNHQIKVLASDHAVLFTLGSGRSGIGRNVFDRPEGITIQGQDIWFSDTYNDRIVRYQIVNQTR